jgi:hypothetical protein
MHKKLYFEYPSYWGQSRLEGVYDLLDATNTVEAMRHLPDARVPRIDRVNERFYLTGPIPGK